MRTELLPLIATLAFLLPGCGGGENGDSAVGGAAPSAAAVAAAASNATADGALTIVFTNNIDGEIEPCG